MAVTLSGIIIGCLQCLIRKWRRKKKSLRLQKNPTKHTHLKIMKVVMNPGGHRTVLFSRAEKKRNGEKSSMLNPGAISGLLCTPGRQESNANVRRLMISIEQPLFMVFKAFKEIKEISHLKIYETC